MRMVSTDLGTLAGEEPSRAPGIRPPIQRQILRPLGCALTRPPRREARWPATTPTAAARFARAVWENAQGTKLVSANGSFIPKRSDRPPRARTPPQPLPLQGRGFKSVQVLRNLLPQKGGG